jgi:hypothetical protein
MVSMASNRNERRSFQTDGPKRRRKTRREIWRGEGGYTQWSKDTNPRPRIIAARAPRQEDFS